MLAHGTDQWVQFWGTGIVHICRVLAGVVWGGGSSLEAPDNVPDKGKHVYTGGCRVVGPEPSGG